MKLIAWLINAFIPAQADYSNIRGTQMSGGDDSAGQKWGK